MSERKDVNRRHFLYNSMFFAVGSVTLSASRGINLPQLVSNTEKVKLVVRVKYADSYSQFCIDNDRWMDIEKLVALFAEQQKAGVLVSVAGQPHKEFYEIQMVFNNYQSYLICNKQYDAMTNKALRSQLGYKVEELLFVEKV